MSKKNNNTLTEAKAEVGVEKIESDAPLLEVESIKSEENNIMAEEKKIIGYELNDAAKKITGRVNVIFRGRKKPSSVRLLTPKELVVYAKKLKESDKARFLKPIYK